MLIAEIEHSERSVGGNRSKNARLPPRNIVDFLIVGDQLRLDHPMLDIPYRARGVDATRADSSRLNFVPVEGSEWGTELVGQAVIEDVAKLDARGGCVGYLPETEELAGGGEERGGLVGRRAGMEH